MTRARVIAVSVTLLALTGPMSSADAPAASAAETKASEVADWLEAHTGKLTPDEIAAASRTLVEEADRTGLAVELVLAVIEVESGGDPTARSAAGAIGLMQLRPATAAETARALGLPWNGPSSLADPVVNIRLGVTYLKKLLDRFGDVSGALAAYNWGPARIARRLARGAPLPGGYVSRVEAAFGLPVERGVGWL